MSTQGGYNDQVTMGNLNWNLILNKFIYTKS